MKIPDLNSGLRVMKKSVLEKYIQLFPNGFSFTTTITLAMICNQYSVKYVPIDYFKRSGKSKIRPIHDKLNFIQLIIRTVLYFDPLRIFYTLSFAIGCRWFFRCTFSGTLLPQCRYHSRHYNFIRRSIAGNWNACRPH